LKRPYSATRSGGKLRGGSTISQQTAKNVFLWQGSGWTRYVRKVPEVYFTFLIETIWGKPRIMEVYLNVAETGIGTYGAEAGAQRYFKKSAESHASGSRANGCRATTAQETCRQRRWRASPAAMATASPPGYVW
jgi:membrane carboxypeptidase/penicillin-binding protein PbpC